MATHSSILAWEIPWTEGALQATVHGVTKESDMTQRLNNNNRSQVTFQLLYLMDEMMKPKSGQYIITPSLSRKLKSGLIVGLRHFLSAFYHFDYQRVSQEVQEFYHFLHSKCTYFCAHSQESSLVFFFFLTELTSDCCSFFFLLLLFQKKVSQTP